MNPKLRKYLKRILFPVVIFRRRQLMYLNRTNPAKGAKMFYKRSLHKELDLDNPRDLNQKIQWLKLYSDIDFMQRLADKYEVREYVREVGLEHILTELYGVWDSGYQIDFDSLPDSFVLKPNHGSGHYAIVTDKNKIDGEKMKKVSDKWLKKKYGILSGERQYWNIKPKLIAEQLMKGSDFSTTVVDYKFYCVNGEPNSILICYDRENSHHVHKAVYDTNWNPVAGSLVDSEVTGDEIPRPETLEKMVEYAAILSKPFPFVRVDFYTTGDKVYFGEMTFAPHAGVIHYHTQEFLDKLGDMVTIDKNLRKK